MAGRCEEMLDYMITNNQMGNDLRLNMAILGELQRLMYQYGEGDLAKEIEGK